MTWLSTLDKKQRNALIGSTTGWAVDGFDFVLYSFVIPTLIAAWSMTRAEAGLIATGALLTSALGGWVAGMLADRFGRVRVLQWTVVWFSICTFLSGFTHSFEQLLIVRALQGFGFGGEWAVGAVLVAEVMEAKHRGKAVGVMQSGYAVGWALATVAFSVFFSLLPAELAWRALFIVGILPALLVVYLRRHVSEPEVFVAQRKHAQAEGRPSVTEIFSRRLLRTTAFASLLAIGIQGAYYSVLTWLPTYLTSTRHLSPINTGGYLLVLILGSFLGYLAGAFLMDVIGRRRTFVIFALLSAAMSYVYFAAQLPDALIMLAGFPLGFTVSGMVGGFGAFLSELFPTRVRATGQGFSYNFGRVIAACFPPLIGVLSNHLPLATAMVGFALASFGCVIVAALCLPETQGVDLEEAGHAVADPAPIEAEARAAA
ncbi:MAG: MFS transporter [Pseudacidovorax sp.]|nr:MFS transporter [Pseudacidovorax sp.]